MRKSFVTLLLIISFFCTRAQQHNWHLLSHRVNHVYGAGVEQAYNNLKWKTPKMITVAVIDGGTDTAQEDLKGMIWTNQHEIPGNGIDDDGNGYADDAKGWDFIGGKNGDIVYEAEEKTRIYQQLERKYRHMDTAHLSANETKDFAAYKQQRKEYLKAQAKRENEAKGIEFMYNMNKHWFWHHLFRLLIGKDADDQLLEAKTVTVKLAEYSKLNVDSIRRAIVGDDPDNPHERHYGNTDVTGPDAMHGTHTAGIIAALRHNNIGGDGIVNSVRIMIIRAVPSGDERDKDIANAIRYAADNGASVISMSFGKYKSPDKLVVDSAVMYAQSKDVLLVHAAGNEATDIDTVGCYPNPRFLSGGYADNWIEVGATRRKGGKKLVASFSNYGQKTVDMFAPGVNIYSTLPGNKYGRESGTSMSAPVVAGVAAMIRSYFPELKAHEVKEILMKTVTHYKGTIRVPGHKKIYARLEDISVSGGIINAESAVNELLKK